MLQALLLAQLAFDSLCNLALSFHRFYPFEHYCLWFRFLVTLRFVLWSPFSLALPAIFPSPFSIFPLLLRDLFSSFAISTILPYTSSLFPKIISWSSLVNASIFICLALVEAAAKVASDCLVFLPLLLISFIVLLFIVVFLSSFAIIFLTSTFLAWLWFLIASSLLAIFSFFLSCLSLGIIFQSLT